MKSLEDDFKPDLCRLETLVDKHKLPLPGDKRVFAGELKNADRQKCLFLYTDLEPDDTFAILCHLEADQAVLVDEPVTVFTTDIEGKDAKDTSPIFEKKLLLALFALGKDFVEGLIIVRHSSDDVKLGKEYESLGTPDERLQTAAKKFIRQAVDYPESTVEFLVMAPGHGNLEKLHKYFQEEAAKFDDTESKFDEGKTWKDIKARTKVSICKLLIAKLTGTRVYAQLALG